MLLLPQCYIALQSLYVGHICVNIIFYLILDPRFYANRMAGFSLYVSNTTSTKQGFLCYKDQSSGTPSVDQTFPCSIYGRYVIYYNERSRYSPSYFSQYAYNELCELQVFGEYIPNYLVFTYFKTRLNYCLFLFISFLDRMSW